MDDIQRHYLLEQLVSLPDETEWVEFKQNKADSQEIGEYISALSNSAVLCGKSAGYIVWGIADDTHEIVGTTFRPRTARVGNQELENWLATLLTPAIDFMIHDFMFGDKNVVIFEVQPARDRPVSFRGTEYVRCGSYKQPLKKFPEKERQLWRHFDTTPFEKQIAAFDITGDEVLRLIDYPAYFDLIELRLPDNRIGILEKLESEKFIVPKPGGLYDITNLGGILFAKNLGDFEGLGRKAIRVIVYNGTGRVETIREQSGVKGYAVGFEGAIDFINNLLPMNEVIGKALRQEVKMFPELAIRELVANMIIHQDFSLTGTGPKIEIFSDRMEITNPGVPLIDTLRFIDGPPQSRNEILASFMRRIKICEERGSGIDKVVSQVEFYQLPAPEFLVVGKHTKAILFAHRELAQMDKNDRVRACYQHACLKYVSSDFMTNASLRERLSITKQNYPMASRIIKDAISPI